MKQIEPRRPGEAPTLQARAESYETVDKQKRYRQILECLDEKKQVTAKECAVMLFEKGYTPAPERNYAAPRITELCQQGIVEPIGKTCCEYTGKTVTVFARRDKNETMA